MLPSSPLREIIFITLYKLAAMAWIKWMSSGRSEIQTYGRNYQ
jgi:hypothetical protein